MDAVRFDRISSMFAQRRLTRRHAMQQGTAGLAAVGLASTGVKAAAQDSTPAAGSPARGKTEYLFVQSFQGGSIVPKEGTEGTYTVTLQHGLGQTLYFSNRPERIVGAAPTQQFLDGLGFNAENPPNAALVIGTEAGGTDIAVIELTNPTYDAANATATYDITVLENFEAEVDMALQDAPADLATVASSFGAAHLFIDDCKDDGEVICTRWNPETGFDPSQGNRALMPVPYCWHAGGYGCEPCDPDGLIQACYDEYPDLCHQDKDDCRYRWI